MKNFRTVRRTLVASAVTSGLFLAGGVSAQAVESANTSSDSTVPAIAVSDIMAKGYTEQDILAAIADSPYVTIEAGPATPRPGLVMPQDVDFGRCIYVRISQATAKAINASTAAGAVAILGLATGGVGIVIATLVYGYLASLSDSALSRCARWEFRLTYPTPWTPSRIVYAGCY